MSLRSPGFIAIIITVLAVLWVLSGMVGGDKAGPAEATAIQTAVREPQVQVQTLYSEPFLQTVKVTGRTQAARIVQIRAETDGQIKELPLEKGRVVKKGDVLAKLEIRDRAARVEEAKQLVNQRQIQFNAASDLEKRGFNSKVRLAEARAELEAARAALKQANVDLGNTSIRAPFDGVVTDQVIEVGDYARGGDILLTIAEMDPIEMAVYLTEKQVVYIETGTEVKAVLLTGQQTTGRVTYVASAADPQTRTFLTEISLPNPDLKIRDGLTAEVEIPMREIQATKIPPAVIALADDGALGVKIVQEDDSVLFLPIEVLKDTADYMWVSGLPASAKVITVGQEFVIDGQHVKASGAIEQIPGGLTK